MLPSLAVPCESISTKYRGSSSPLYSEDRFLLGLCQQQTQQAIWETKDSQSQLEGVTSNVYGEIEIIQKLKEVSTPPP